MYPAMPTWERVPLWDADLKGSLCSPRTRWLRIYIPCLYSDPLGVSLDDGDEAAAGEGRDLGGEVGGANPAGSNFPGTVGVSAVLEKGYGMNGVG